MLAHLKMLRYLSLSTLPIFCKITDNFTLFVFEFIEQHFQQVCPSRILLASERKFKSEIPKIPKITCSTVRGLILLAIQDGTAEYLEPQANLKLQTVYSSDDTVSD